RLAELAGGGVDETLLSGLAAMVEREVGTPDFGLDIHAAAPIEAYFAGVAGHAVDARAARLLREFQKGRRLPTSQLLALAVQFRAQGRVAGELRWLARAFALDPGSVAAADGLVALCMAHGRLTAAAAVAEVHSADRTKDLEWQRRLAQLGAWLGRPELEADALERVVALAGDGVAVTAERDRLIELYAHLGKPERGLPHAVAIADGAAEPAAAEEAADTALAAGFVDEGLAMLRRAAARAPTAAPWLRRFAELARQDLRLGDVTVALESAAELDPEVADRELEDVYRRTDQPGKLADLLERRLLRDPGDERVWQELITLRAALGQRDEARLLVRRRDIALADPDCYVEQLSPELRARAGAIRSQALALSLTSSADGTIVGETLEKLRPFFAQREFRELAELLLTRHPDDPRAKPMRRELVDYGRTPLAAERAAAALSATYPDDPELARFWLARAQWADHVPGQIAARERLAMLAPDDLDNHYELGDLLEFGERTEAALAQWQRIVDREGLQSRAVPRLIDGLFALGREDQAVEWLQQLAEHPAATAAQRLAAADELFFRRSYDRARVLYRAVLAEDANEPRALLRMGQIAAWTNDPRSARQFLERRLLATDAEAALVRFYLGETLWSLGETSAARGEHERALAAYEAIAAPDLIARACMATMYARLGRREAALAAYRELVACSPRDVDLVLDYADVVLQDGDLALAQALARHAGVLAPDRPRALRLDAAIAARAGDYTAADRAYERILAAVGADAAVLGEQSQLRLENGDWTGALASAERWRHTQPDSVAAARTEFDVRQRLANLVVGDVRHRRLGSDRSTAFTAGGTFLLDERHWLQGSLAAVSQRGATGLGSGRASADYVRVDAAVGWRPGATDRLLLGVSAAPGANGDAPVGLFAAGNFAWQEPFRSLRVRAGLHELFAEPMAAAALGGRQSGIDVAGYIDLGAGVWAAVGGGIDRLAIEPAGSAGLDDVRWHGDAALGWRLIDGDVAVTSPFDARVAPAGPESPFLDADPEVTRPWLCNAWLGWQSAHLLGDAALAGPLPLLKDDDFVVSAVRVDRHVARGFGASATGYAGFDSRRGGSVWGVEGALTWRPAFATEVALSGRYGEALGRSGDGRDEQLRCEVVWRW
ncbi:MAG: tetratricopeptide repeat protein, partial [Planctomycetes bacterium]|nr:tetratricopeptide repeat protein [Planctomycetota bacterium]